jgi:hypothetical protein|tara:strand:- start:1275 stop:1940 length:666 start_codon:yes stop_codon:yes gene_type:complete
MKNLKLDAHKRQWYAYYSEKRIVHQWFQVKLLENLPVQRIMEIGPAYGVPTALLANAGYEVTTLDFMERKLLGASSHIIADLWKADPKVYSNQDCILCCEVLEHFPFEKSCDLLTKFYKSKVPYLVLSVPYNAPQLNFNLYINSHTVKKYTAFKFRNSFRSFKKGDPVDGQLGHQWEIGFKNYPLKKLKNAIKVAGWDILKYDFTAATRSVFIVAQNKSIT